VNSSVVAHRVHVVAHVARLGILSEHGIVIRRTRRLHGPQSYAFYVRREEPLADEPIGLVRSDVQGALFDERPKTSEMDLVQSARLVQVVQIALRCGHAMGELVAYHIHGNRESMKICWSPSPKTILSPSQYALS